MTTAVSTPYDLPDYRAFVRGIRGIDRAGGNGTLARLVAADWLDERGEQARANYIRLSCELEAMGLPDGACRPDCPCGGLAGRVEKAFSEMLGCGNDDWPAGSFHTWQVGFVDKTRCDLKWWLVHGPDLCRLHPVRSVALTDSAIDLTNWFTDVNLFYKAIHRPVLLFAHKAMRFQPLISAATRYADVPDSDWRPQLSAVALQWAEADRESGRMTA